MRKVLVVVDMQNDFVYGSLGSEMAQAIVPNVKKKIEEYKSNGNDVIFTKDTHFMGSYAQSLEGQKLPIEHCIFGTKGWNVIDEIRDDECMNLEKRTFGFNDWGFYLWDYDEIEIIGVCTDICVVSNALIIRMLYPNSPIVVDASCCAGTSVEAHKAALTIMKSCQIDVIGE